MRRAGLVLLVVALVGCSSSSLTSTVPADAPPIVVQPATISPGALVVKGQVVNDSLLTGLDDGLSAVAADARRAVYKSVSAPNGQETEVSGSFFVPKGVPPTGGWPVVSLAHGTTGIEQGCGPSLRSDLMGYASAVKGLLASGHAVAFTDYEGLGAGGEHAFLEPRTAAYNIIDAVRALRALYPSVSSQWLALGGSQGGQASWAANEYDSSYGEGLTLMGSVAIAPAVNISAVGELAYMESLTRDQLGVMPLVIVGLERADPALSESDYLHGSAAENRDTIIGCGAEAQHLRGSVRPDDVRPSSRAAADTLRDALRRMALPQQPLTAPMLVVNGSRDTVVFPQWVSAAVARSCALGGQIEHVEVANAGHTDISDDGVVATWIADRFAGTPAPANCPSPP